MSGSADAVVGRVGSPVSGNADSAAGGRALAASPRLVTPVHVAFVAAALDVYFRFMVVRQPPYLVAIVLLAATATGSWLVQHWIARRRMAPGVRGRDHAVSHWARYRQPGGVARPDHLTNWSPSAVAVTGEYP